MVTQTIKIDLTKDIITDHIVFKQGEIGREIEFEVYNDGVAVDLDGYDVTFSIYKPDGNFVIVSGTIDNDTVTIEETEQMTAVCGSGCFDLALTKTNEVIYTFKGFVDIATPIVTRATVNSVSTVFGLVFPDDFQEKLTAGENITIVDNVISASGGGGSYTAGDYISILNNVIDVKSSLISTINGKADASALNGKQDKLTAGDNIDIDENNVIDVKSSLISTINGKADASALNGKQDKLTAGDNITIVDNVISASGGGGGGFETLWTGEWNGQSELYVEGLNDWAIVGYGNYSDQAGLTEQAMISIGTPELGGMVYLQPSQNSYNIICHRFAVNHTTEKISAVNSTNRGLSFSNGTTYSGAYNCYVRQIYGIVKKANS